MNGVVKSKHNEEPAVHILTFPLTDGPCLFHFIVSLNIVYNDMKKAVIFPGKSDIAYTIQ